MEENKNLSADLNIMKQQCAELELDQGCWLKMQQLAEKALEAENKRQVTFSLEVREALESAVTIQNANAKVHMTVASHIKSNSIQMLS